MYLHTMETHIGAILELSPVSSILPHSFLHKHGSTLPCGLLALSPGLQLHLVSLRVTVE